MSSGTTIDDLRGRLLRDTFGAGFEHHASAHPAWHADESGSSPR
jgi:hypothetical protein